MSARILHNLSLLLDRPFATVAALNRYRKELSSAASGAAIPIAA